MAQTVARWESLLPFVRDAELLRVCIDAGTLEAAAERLGTTPERVRGRLNALEYDAGRRGWHPGVPLPEEIPTGFHVKRLSMHYGEREDGSTKRTGWVITEPEKEHKVAALLRAVEEACRPIEGLAEPMPEPQDVTDDLLCIYPIGDLHLGMYAWAEEAGESFDLKICEGMIIDAMRRIIQRAPRARRAMVVNLGDWFHSDTPDNRTRRSGHPLDVDGRWSKVYDTGIRIQCAIMELALRHHQVVELINLIGNHDDLSAQTLSHAMRLYFRNEPRVEVDCSPAQHRYREHGLCLFGLHHGHETKTNKLLGDMSVDRREAWGRTLYRAWYCGHIHSERVREDREGTVEYFRTLTPRDAWATGQGYRSDRDLRVDVWHKGNGLDARYVVRGLPRPKKAV